LAFAAFLVWRLWTGACGVGACGFWRYRMTPPQAIKLFLIANENAESTLIARRFKSLTF